MRVLDGRRAGVLLHPTSLPSGRLDDDALRWLDFMARSGLRVWQMLPLTIPDAARSPYQSCSAFAADPGLFADGPTPTDEELERFRRRTGYWVEDFACYQVLAEQHRGIGWERWPASFAHRQGDAMDEFRHRHRQRIETEIAEQCRIDLAFDRLRREAAGRDVLLFGDVPIFVSYHSADVWAHREYFLLDHDLRPRWVTGVPPDYFSATGQRWGNPHYDWGRLEGDGFEWWLQRFERQFEWFDLLRVDHFRGLESAWMIDAEQQTAARGHWAQVPGDRLLEALRRRRPQLPVVAEDLGIITDEVRALRRRFGLPGMAVLQFAFDGSPENPHRPANIGEDTVVYTGTHDNDTTAGWFAGLDRSVRDQVFATLQREPREDMADVLWQAALQTAARLAVAPLQDLLGLGSEARMNTPGTPTGNWRWRFRWDQLSDRLADRIRAAVEASGR